MAQLVPNLHHFGKWKLRANILRFKPARTVTDLARVSFSRPTSFSTPQDTQNARNHLKGRPLEHTTHRTVRRNTVLLTESFKLCVFVCSPAGHVFEVVLCSRNSRKLSRDVKPTKLVKPSPSSRKAALLHKEPRLQRVEQMQDRLN